MATSIYFDHFDIVGIFWNRKHCKFEQFQPNIFEKFHHHFFTIHNGNFAGFEDCNTIFAYCFGICCHSSFGKTDIYSLINFVDDNHGFNGNGILFLLER